MSLWILCPLVAMDAAVIALAVSSVTDSADSRTLRRIGDLAEFVCGASCIVLVALLLATAFKWLLEAK